MATVLDLAVWYYVKDLIIFDKKGKKAEREMEDMVREKSGGAPPSGDDAKNKN